MSIPAQIVERLAAVGVRLADIEERFVRGGGPGGQKINKTSSTVWLRHSPTGMEARCQRERSQAANRELAWVELVEKLEANARAREEAVIDRRERERRRNRKKSHAQKVRMVESKRRRARVKGGRGRVGLDS